MKTIGIPSFGMSFGLRRMFDALGAALDVRFEERTFGEDSGIDAWILLEADRWTLHHLAHVASPCYTVLRGDQLVPCGESSTIEFTSHSAVLSVLSGRQINSDEAVKLMALPRWLHNVTVLAAKEKSPIWAVHEVEGNGHHYVTLPVPELNEGESLFRHFHGNQFLFLLPLLIFLRSLTGDQRWEQPPLQACFMFDDPNLHWPTYGFVNFAEILQHARVHNHHVSFATIPLDTWFTHRPTAALFKQHPDRLSLLIHGCDHITDELARTCSEKERDRILLQALGRIGAFEQSTGVAVPRVMAAPHGACSERFLEKMAQLGFEAACISSGSLRHYNGQAPWLRTLGMKPSDIIAGLTVFPRFRLSGNCHNSILIAALLNQPIIPVGHHYDMAEGPKLLADLAGFVNSLGTVHWADMKGISRSHYARMLDGKVLRLRMFTKHIDVCVPEGTNQIWVERPWLREAGSRPLAWKLLGAGSEWTSHDPDEAILVQPGQHVEIISELPTSPFIYAKNVRNYRLWPVVRRQLTETRDRLAPVIRRISNFLVKSNGSSK